MDYRTIYTTTRDKIEAEMIGEVLVKERLAACANLIPGMKSIYHWHGHLEYGEETVLLLKTRADLAQKAIQRIRELHSYSVPCVVSWEIMEGNETYLRWIDSETGK